MYRSYQAKVSEIAELSCTVDINNPEIAIQNILEEIRPDWQWESVDVKKLTDGVVNHMWKVNERNKTDDIILIRAFDPSTTIFDRETEFQYIRVLNKARAIMPFYARFKNGYAYKFEDGETLTPQQLVDPRISKMIMQKLHEFHSVDVSEVKNDKDFVKGVAALVTGGFGSPASDKLVQSERYIENFPSKEDVIKEVQWAMENVYEPLLEEFPAVFGQNDEHINNIVYNPTKDRITFIDFDCLGTCSELWGLAIHLNRDTQFKFKEAGVEIMEDEAFKRKWLKQYLELHPQYKNEVTEDLVDKWLVGLNKAIYLESKLLQQWALLQAAVTADSTFDYLGYAIQLQETSAKARKLFTL